MIAVNGFVCHHCFRRCFLTIGGAFVLILLLQLLSLNNKEMSPFANNGGQGGPILSGRGDQAAIDSVRAQILSLSRKYVSKLAEDEKELIDLPYDSAAGRVGIYDLKKTLAVLIDSIMIRLDSIEESVRDLKLSVARDKLHRKFDGGVGGINNSGRASFDSVSKIHESNEKNSNLKNKLVEDQMIADPGRVQAKKALIEIHEFDEKNCELQPEALRMFPNCLSKAKWMETFWRSDPCYESHGVDGSRCSFIIYLGEVERHCPHLSWRPERPRITPPIAIASPKFHYSDLFNRMNDNPVNFQWIQSRIGQMWPKFVSAYGALALKQNWTLENRKRKTILLHLGFLTKESGFKFGEKSLKGGPLGELVQWSDLIAALYFLGHDLVISSEMRTFVTYAQADPAMRSSCPVLTKNHVDVIYTDIVGLRQMKKKIPASLQNYRCRLRVLDSFGSQAEFNSLAYFNKHKGELRGNKRDVWGGHALNLQQFYTMFPHTPDNCFLGFVVNTHENKLSISGDVAADEQSVVTLPPKKRWAVVYGKEIYMWKGMERYLEIASEYFEIHATVSLDGGAGVLPPYVKNHGVLDGPKFHELLSQAKAFLGLGFPYEGPAPLEAIANGAVFINPLFKTPKGRQTDKFFAEKPTLRALNSQNPYVQDFIGEPYALTVDISDELRLRTIFLRLANSSDLIPFLPYEFTAEGMLERCNAFVEHQDFCRLDQNWPPFSAHRFLIGQLDYEMSKTWGSSQSPSSSFPPSSCAAVCWNAGLICEPSYFPKINAPDGFGHNFGITNCSTTKTVSDVWVPAYDPANGLCLIQGDPIMFSCSSRVPTELAGSTRRLCPCRDYIKDQTALCAGCL